MLQSIGTSTAQPAASRASQSSEKKGVVELKDLAPLLLKKERAGGDLDFHQLTLLTNSLRGSAEKNARRKQLVQLVADHPVLSNKDMMFRNHKQMYDFGLQKCASLVQLLAEHNVTDRVERKMLRVAIGETVPLELHEIMFIPALETQATDAQQQKWLGPARNHQILGSYAQTELGHGSNIQGIETTAHFDKVTQEFIINSPTLTSRKWWPGGLGKTATHALVYARLFLEDGGKKDVGVQAFMVQLRSLETHEPLPGIEVGDIGPKVGVNAVDNGYGVFTNVRVPRENMLMRFAQVLSDGSFVKPKSDKLVYLTMVQVRAYMVEGFSHMMGSAATIATRFSAARVQGRARKKTKSEFQVLDYQNQQHTLLPLIGLSYAASFMGQSMVAMHDAALAAITRSDGSDGSFELKLAELHGASSGLKAWLSENVSNGIEACRRSCGGHGFTESSNLHYLYTDTVGTTTYEGTFDVLVQQHARFLLKAHMLLQGVDPVRMGKKKNTVSFLSRSTEFSDGNLQCRAQQPEDFDDLELLVEAFEVRSARIIMELAAQMEECDNDGNACMLQMARASTAHSELMLLSAFVQGVDAFPTGSTVKSIVAKLCALFGAWLVVKNLSDFCESGYFSSFQARLIRQQVARLLPVIRKNAVLLTDAWDFSDFELNSTIGRYDGDIYRALVKRAADEPLNKTQVPESFTTYLRPLIQSGL